MAKSKQERNREYYQKHREEIREKQRIYREKNKRKILETQRNYVKNNRIKTALARIKIRAKEHGWEFNLTPEDIIIPDVCPILGIPLEWGNTKNKEYSPSIDRIDSSKGYTKDNIWVISTKANVMKNNATFEEILRFCEVMPKYIKKWHQERIRQLKNEESYEN